MDKQRKKEECQDLFNSFGGLNTLKQNLQTFLKLLSGATEIQGLVEIKNVRDLISKRKNSLKKYFDKVVNKEKGEKLPYKKGDIVYYARGRGKLDPKVEVFEINYPNVTVIIRDGNSIDYGAYKDVRYHELRNVR